MSNELTEAEVDQWLVDRERGGWHYAVERILAARETALRAQIAKEIRAGRRKKDAFAGYFDLDEEDLAWNAALERDAQIAEGSGGK